MPEVGVDQIAPDHGDLRDGSAERQKAEAQETQEEPEKRKPGR